MRGGQYLLDYCRCNKATIHYFGDGLMCMCTYCVLWNQKHNFFQNLRYIPPNLNTFTLILPHCFSALTALKGVDFNSQNFKYVKSTEELPKLRNTILRYPGAVSRECAPENLVKEILSVHYCRIVSMYMHFVPDSWCCYGTVFLATFKKWFPLAYFLQSWVAFYHTKVDLPMWLLG